MSRRQYISPTPGEFPLIASTPWNVRATATPTVEDFRRVKDAGFNAGFLSASLSQMKDIRFAAKTVDFKLIISIGSLGVATDDMKSFVKTATGSADDSNSTKLNGADDSDIITAWAFTGSPKLSEFKNLSNGEAAYKQLYGWDTGRNIFVTLCGWPDPDYVLENTSQVITPDSYRKYVDRFCVDFSPMVLGYNYYPFYVSSIGVSNTDYSQFYEDLIIFSRKYKETGIPFWNYVQCAYVKRASNGSILYSEATEWTLRFQIFNSLAFCVQGLIFWTYGRRPSDANDIFVSALLNDSGNLTKAGEAVKRINKEIRCLTDIFLGAVPLDYYAATQPLSNDPDNPIDNLPSLPDNGECPYYVWTEGGKGALVTTFNSKDKQVPSKLRHYLMVVSMDIEKSQSTIVKFKSELDYGVRLKAYSILPNLDSENGGFIKSEIQTDTRLEFSLPRSGYLLFEYEML